MAIDVILQPPTAHLDKAEGALRQAQLLLDAAEWDGAVSRLYYAVMHAAHAVLATKGLVAHTHKGTQSLVAMHFVQHRLLPIDFSTAFGHRQADRELADYGPPDQIFEAVARRAAREAALLMTPMLDLLEEANAETRARLPAVRERLEAVAAA